MRFNSFLNRVGLSRKAHQGSPAPGGVTNAGMPGAGAPSQVNSWVSLRLYLPLMATALVGLAAILFVHGASAATTQSSAEPKPVGASGDSVSLVIASKDCKQSSDGGPTTKEVIKDGAYQINENNGAGCVFTIKAAMNQNQTADTPFAMQVAGYGDSPAEYDNDYETSIAPGTTFTVPQGASESPARAVKVQVRCDHQAEGDEMLAIKFVNQARSLESNALLINIIDNCVPAEQRKTTTVTLSATPNPVDEGDQTVITATLSPAPTTDMSITVMVTSGTAESGDYTGGGEKRLDFPAGIATSSLIIGANQDDDADDETLTVAMSTSPPGVEAGETTSLTITITDDDAIQIQFDPTMYTRSEGIDPYANVTVVRSRGANTENAIDFTLTAKEVPEDSGAGQGGASNATPGSDFVGGAYKGTIPAGATSATVNIPILDDNIAEVPEDFLVTLTSDDTSEAVVIDKRDEALVSLNDNDDVRLSYQTDYLKLGEPGWKHRTGELAIHVDIGTSKRITMTCSSKDGKVAPFQWDIPVSSGPQTSRVTVSPVKDGDFKYDYDTLTCGLRHAPVMVKTEKLKSGIPVWVEDGDALNIPKGEFYLGGDMVKPGFQANMTLFVTRPEGVNSSETFNIDYLNPHYCDKAKMTGPSSVTVPESRGTNNILFSVQVPSNSCDVYVIRAMPTTPDTYQGAAQTGGFGLVHVVTPPRAGGL